ncbi:hypothetical protein ACS0TY_008703 [Phlomoides rotata]
MDGGFFADSFQMGVGMIVRDDEGGFVVCRSLLVDGLFDVGEVMALYEALLWLQNLGLENVIVEVDYETVTDALNNPSLDYNILIVKILKKKNAIIETPTSK